MEQKHIFLFIRRGEIVLKGLINLLKASLIKYKIILTLSGLFLVVGVASGLMIGNFGNYVYGAETKRESQIQSLPVVEKSNIVIEPVQSHAIAVEKVCLDISGAVVSPGVYCLDPDSRLFKFIESAGGFDFKKFARDYVYQRLNLASFPSTGTKVYVPYEGEVSCKLELPSVTESPNFSGGKALDDDEYDSTLPAEGVSKPVDDDLPDEANDSDDIQVASCDGKIGLNKSPTDKLQELPGIGASTAQKIIDARPFLKIEDLLNVSGIGDAKFAAIKDLVCID